MVLKPTDEQQKIIDDKSRFISVQAGPGTGKTFTICRKIEKYLKEGLLQPTERILFCTYTNALTSSNLQSLMKDGTIDIGRVRTATLDSFLVEVLQKMAIPDRAKKVLADFEGAGYTTARNLANRIFNEKANEVKAIFELASKRYPYIFIDEIQDIKDKESQVLSPKYQFLKHLSECSFVKQLIIVGDEKQSIFGGNDRSVPFSLPVEPLKLTKSQRKPEHSGESIPEIIKAGMNCPLTVKKTILSAISDFNEQNYGSDTMIILENFAQFNYKPQLNQLTIFWYHSAKNGQHVLPQSIIESLFWFRDIRQSIFKKTLECILLPFQKVLNKQMTFTYFRCFYFKLLKANVSFGELLVWLLDEACDVQNPKVKKLRIFYQEHAHLYTKKIQDFTHKLVVSTIDSAKGLEAEDVYFFMQNGNDEMLSSREPSRRKFVAHTRNKKRLYLCHP